MLSFIKLSRAVLLFALFLIFAVGSEAHAGPPVSDDFDRANLDTSLWTFVNPLGDGSIRMVGAGSGDAVVELSIPEGASHDPWHINRGVRIMQACDNADFEVEVHFQSEPAQRYQMNGIFVEQDADNWLRFEFLHDGGGLRCFAARTVAGNSTAIFNTPINAGDGSGLRISRTGDSWTLSYLDGGTTWTPAGGAFMQVLTVTSVGPYVANHESSGSSPATTVIIDSFQNTASPINPEDDGAPPDVDGPFIHNSSSETSGADALTFRFATDEPATGTVHIGTTPAYEIGSFTGASGLTAHAIEVSGLTAGQTYHYALEAVDGLFNASETDDAEIEFIIPGAPNIDIWYGDVQTFGVIGQPQPWVNILGRVSDPDDDITSLSYQLNGMIPSVALSIGPDTRRLENEGDFNVDLATADLSPGTNTVVITATDAIGNVTEKTVTVNYTPGTMWPLPYAVDWSTLADASELQQVGQVVDGLWSLEAVPGGAANGLAETFVRTLEPGYDRLLAIGDRTWTDYESEVPIIIHSMPGGYGTGVLLRWDGHTDFPVSGWQPKSGYLPLGCILWARPGKIELYGNGGQILDSQSRSLAIGTTYMFKGRVETVAGVGGLYSLKVWEAGLPEPSGWDITGQEALTDPQAGSMLLISHQADASFGPVSVVSLEQAPDMTPPVISNVQVNATQSTATIEWTTDEAADSVVAYGTSPVYDLSESSAAFTLNHQITLLGLAPGTTYHFQVSSADPSGNVGSTADMTLTTDPVGNYADLKSDEFNEPVLDGGIWTFVDAPQSDGTLAMTGTQASLSVPAGVEHQVWTSGIRVPRIVQYVNDGDFEVELKVDSALESQYEEQGIVVEQDPSNFLRFELYSTNSGTLIFAASIHNGVANVAINANVPLTAPYYMRLRREGSIWMQSYSDDGVTWLPGGTINDALAMTSLGLYVGNAIGGSSPAHEALFDYFRVTPVPCPGDANGDDVVDINDLNMVLGNFASSGPMGDVNNDGSVDITDLGLVIGNFGSAC